MITKRLRWIRAVITVLLPACAVFSFAPPGFSLSVPLTIRETQGVPRTAEIVTTGVPIPKGQLSSDQACAISGADGQFETLATWGDGSVKWLLVSFPATVGANSNATFQLVNGSGNSPAGPLQVTQSGTGVTVSTGPIKFTMKSTGFNLFDEVWLDSNNDGSFAAGERIVSPRATNGSIVEEPDGDKFTSTSSPSVEFVVEESGPLRAVIAFEGIHSGSAGTHLNFSGRVYAYRNRSDVRVQYSQANMIPTDTYSGGNQPLCRWLKGQGPVGGTNNSLFMEDLSLVTRADLAGAPKFSIQGDPATATQSGNLTADSWLYQDSSAGPYWFVSDGTTFSGYQIRNGSAQLASGSRAQGFADINDGNRGVAVAIRHFWENFPNKLMLSPDGTITVGVMPRDFSTPYEHRPGERKTHWTMFYFHNGDAAAAKVSDVAAGFQKPLRAMASAQYYADSKALDDLVPYNPSAFSDYETHCRTGANGFLDAREDSDFYGWQDFGDLWSDFEGGGSPPNTNNAANNLEYDSGFVFIQQALRTTGLDEELSQNWWDQAEAGNEHVADIDVYHVTEGPLRWMWGGMWNHTGHGYSGYDDPHRGSSPNGAHTWNRGMLYWYYLTGDRNVLDSALKVGENMTWRVENGPGMPGISGTDGEERGPGHTLQILVDMYLFTWDQRYLTAARKAVTDSHADVQAYIQSPDSGDWRCKPWMIAILMRNLGRFAEVMKAEKGITETQAIDSLLKYANFMERKAWVDRNGSEPGFIYYQVEGTGVTIPPVGDNNVNMWTVRNSDAFTFAYRFETDPSKKARYREIAQVSFEDGSAYPWCYTCPRYEYMQAKVQQVQAGSGHEWMKESGGVSNPDAVPPSAVNNLAASAGTTQGVVNLSWTSPGDDGALGRATTYFVRRATSPINSQTAWNSATVVSGAPVPAIAGTNQTMAVTGLTPSQVYYFAIRAQDEAGNLAALSNSPSVTAPAENNPPVILSVNASINNTTLDVTILWVTNEPATGRVEYGTSSSYGSSTPTDPAFKTSHLFTLTGFSLGQTIHYRVRSTDSAGNEIVSPDRTIVIQVDQTNPDYTMNPPTYGTGQMTVNFSATELSFGTFSWGVVSTTERTVALGSQQNPSIAHSATMTGLTTGVTYVTKLVLIDLSGNFIEEQSSLYYPGPVIDTTPPSVPLGLRIKNYSADDGLTLLWNGNSELDLAGYNLKRRPVDANRTPQGDWETVNSSVITASEFTDSSLDPFGYFEYSVRAIDQSINESGGSTAVLYDPERWAGLDFIAVNFPNPFRVGSGTQISFRAPAASGGASSSSPHVNLTVFDVNGRRVKVLYNGTAASGRARTVRWDGTDQTGRAMAAGVYFYRLQSEGSTLEKKMILLR